MQIRVRIRVLNISLKSTEFMNNTIFKLFIFFFDYFQAKTWWTIQNK